MTSNKYIDIHSHILPGVDDGSHNMEETIHMLKTAHKQGIRSIIATPHYFCGRHNRSVEELHRIKDLVQEEAQRIDQDFKIYLGNELFYSESILEDLDSKKALTLAESRYVLVEFGIHTDYKIIYNNLKQILYGGYIPILAHAERYVNLIKKENLVEELIRSGIYIQMNSSSFLGGLFDSEAAYNRKLFHNGLVHLIGSDSHDKKFRPPIMKDTIKKLEKKNDNKLVDQIFLENPRKILDSKYI